MMFLLFLLKLVIIEFIFGMSKDDAITIMKSCTLEKKSRFMAYFIYTAAHIAFSYCLLYYSIIADLYTDIR